MFKDILVAMVLIVVVSSITTAASTNLEITSPVQGQVLQGTVEVSGSLSVKDFASANLSYAYADSQVETWFVISSLDKPINQGVLGKWDTSLISDGDYRLKLSVVNKDGTIEEVIVDSLQVRNYTPFVATQVPALENTVVITEAPTILPESTQVAEPMVTATPFPANLASSTFENVKSEIKNGAIIGVASIFAIGIYALIRGWISRR